MHWVRAAASRTFCTAGTKRAIRMAMMAITTNNSMSVNAACTRGRDRIIATSFWPRELWGLMSRWKCRFLELLLGHLSYPNREAKHVAIAVLAVLFVPSHGERVASHGQQRGEVHSPKDDELLAIIGGNQQVVRDVAFK